MTLRSIELEPRKPGLDRTLILLHGFGADEHDLLPIAHELDPRLRAVSLQAPLSLGGGMRAWFHLAQDARGAISFDPAAARAAVEIAAAEVEAIAKSAAREPYLLGFSQGAAMALGIALTRPRLLAGVLSLSGVAPPALAASELAKSDELSQFPVFAAHGTFDPLLPIQLGRSVRDQLTRLGLSVEWHEYPMAHMVVPDEIADARAWLKREEAGHGR
ncbi:MAG TPA: phospholipase [Myxococcales bacterium]|nr:phospholipase [Myxococcales bacterium]